jgi:hypothetical protein
MVGGQAAVASLPLGLVAASAGVEGSPIPWPFVTLVFGHLVARSDISMALCRISGGGQAQEKAMPDPPARQR